MKKLVVALVVCVGLLCFWIALRKTSSYQLTIKTYFQSAQGLKHGAPVWIDGLQVGSVTDVRVHPELTERPIEVLMAISTPYELSIPRDSTARILAQGVLGPKVVDIDTRMATGSAIANGGALMSVEGTVTSNQAADAMEKIGNVLIQESKKLREQGKPLTAPISK